MMTPMESAAIGMLTAADALIEAFGMVAENQHRLSCGHSVAYGDEAFSSLAGRVEAEIKRLRDVGDVASKETP